MSEAPGLTRAFAMLPPSAPGMRIGLFGGSFNPAHEGHRLVADMALHRLGLDIIWWLVTPGNPLKDHRALAPLAERIAGARAVASHPRMAVTGIEAAWGFTYTRQTLAALAARLPGRRFVWIMGSDSLAGFHRWEHWEAVFGLMPIAVYARPGTGRAAGLSRAARRFAHARLPERAARALPLSAPPRWVLLTGPMSDQSSTAIRRKQGT